MRIALTIDTEQSSHPAGDDNPRRLLDTLAREGVRATLFVTGRWASAFPESARRIANDGHLLGNHSYHHAPLSLMTDEGIRHTVQRAELLVSETTTIDPRPWFRCPYGDGQDDPRVLGMLAELGYGNVPWDVDPRDWMDGRDGRTADDMVRDVIAGCTAVGDGARVLLHSWPDLTVIALPRLIAGLREAGGAFCGVDELDAPHAPPAG